MCAEVSEISGLEHAEKSNAKNVRILIIAFALCIINDDKLTGKKIASETADFSMCIVDIRSNMRDWDLISSPRLKRTRIYTHRPAHFN